MFSFLAALDGIGLAGVVIGVLGVLIIATPFVRKGQLKSSFDLLRTEFETERQVRENQEKRFNERDERCREEVAQLKGQVAVLRRDNARTTATLMADQLIHVMIERGVIPGTGGTNGHPS